MKNKVLKLMALCTMAALPWNVGAVEWEEPVLEFVEPDLSTNGSGGGTYYIYHVGTRKFLTNGNAFDTQLSVGENGQKVTLYYGTDRGLIRTDSSYTHKGWILNMRDAPSNSGFHEVFIADFSTAYVDCNLQGHMLWNIVRQDNGCYRIKAIDEDPFYGESSGDAAVSGTFMGVNGAESTVVLPCVNPDAAGYEEVNGDWKFVDTEEYAVFMAKKALRTKLEEADAIGFTDYASYREVFWDKDATSGKVEEAISGLTDDILSFKYAAASSARPMDVSHLISNPGFDGNADGWATSREPATGQDNFQWQAAQQASSDGTPFVGFFERWIPEVDGNQPDWSITQELRDIPDGRYRLTAYILTNVMANAETGVTSPKGSYLTARSIGEEVRREADIPSPDGNGYAVPYSLDFSVAGGVATIGFRTEDANSNWSGVDNFKLEYLGREGAVGLREMASDRVAEAKEIVQGYESENRAFSQKGKADFMSVAGRLENMVGDVSFPDDSLLSAVGRLEEVMSYLERDMAAYERLYDFVNNGEADAYWNPPYEDLVMASLDDYVMELVDAYEDRTFNPAEIDSVRLRADRLFRQEVAKALVSGETDVATGLLGNYDCSDNTNAGGWQGNGVVVSEGVCEVYNTPTDVYQVLEGLPEGSYEVSANALYRPADNGTCMQAFGLEDDPTNDVLCYLYGNDALEKLPHVFTHTFDTVQAGSGSMVYVKLSTPNAPGWDGKWAVDGRLSAGQAFSEGMFRNTLECYVDADGILRVGVKMPVNSTLTGYWTCFDNFEIKYLGKDDPCGLVSTVRSNMDIAQRILEDKRQTVAEAREVLRQAIVGATEGIRDEEALTKELCEALVDDLLKAISLGEKALQEVEVLDTLVRFHTSGLDYGKYDKYMDSPEYGQLEAVCGEVVEKMAEDALATIDEVHRYVEEIHWNYGCMLQHFIDVSGASKEEAVDVTLMLANPDFEEVTEEGETVSCGKGWDVSFSGGASRADELVYEFFDNQDFDISQVLYGMNPGYYRLAYHGYYRAGDMNLAALAHRDGTEVLNAEAYAQTETACYARSLMSVCEVENPDKYEESDFVLADSLFPDSPNNYHCVVNSTKAGRMAFEDGGYADGFYFQVKEGETVRLGVRKEAWFAGDWACFDKFRLYYYGDGEANRPGDMPDMVGQAVPDGLSVIVTEWFTLGGIRVDKPQQSGLYIRVDRLSNGTHKVVKVLIR